jgi:hypothetical protein
MAAAGELCRYSPLFEQSPAAARKRGAIPEPEDEDGNPFGG